MSESPLLECVGLEKAFSGVRVLKNVSLTVGKGEVLGLVGENGAGKSTLMNVVGGVLRPDSGRMTYRGEPYLPAGPQDASRCGIAFVHQELNLFPNLSVGANIFLTGAPRVGPLLNKRLIEERTKQLLREVDLDVAPGCLVESLPQGERQLVEIAKALRADARLIIFDEPTTSLASREAERLFAMIQRLRESGIAMIYISHTLDDVLRLCDRIIVLRDGEIAGSGYRGELTKERMITLMVGRPIEQLYPARRSGVHGDVVLEVRGVSHPGTLEGVCLQLRRGEILGIAGLMGSGRSELARAIFGLDRHKRGEVILKGVPLGHASPRERIARGMAFLTESRRDDGLFMDAAIDENLDIVHPGSGGMRQIVQSMRISCANLDRQPVRHLSGGNQQKVALGKWLMRTPDVLILDEPTRGIDIGAKYEIYRLMHQLAEKGVGLLVISSELEELTGTCDRILVMCKGEIKGEFTRDFDREELLKAAV